MDERDRQEELHHDMTDTEEAYHAAYPDVRAPIAGGAFLAFFGKHARGAWLWAAAGVVLAIVLWVLYTVYWS